MKATGITIGQALSMVLVTVFAVVLVAVFSNVHTAFTPSHDSQKANCAHIVGDLSDMVCVER